jgi:hypothetical protein
MIALDPAEMLALAGLLSALAHLIRAIWPNGLFK